MAVDTPELERITNDSVPGICAVPSRLDVLAEEEHNARIKDRYRKLINPENKIEDVLPAAYVQTSVYDQPAVQPVMRSFAQPEPVLSRPYQVENARASADIFRADSAINRMMAESAMEQQITDVAPAEEESEDLRPTPTTIQYQTIDAADEQKKVSFATDKRSHMFGKREKIIVAVFVAIVVALFVLVVVNASVIANLNADIAQVQDSITTVRGALAGVNSTVEEIIHNAIGH